LHLYVSSRQAAVGAAALGLCLPFYSALEHLSGEMAVFLIVRCFTPPSGTSKRGGGGTSSPQDSRWDGSP
jgi:hypothetical protein